MDPKKIELQRIVDDMTKDIRAEIRKAIDSIERMEEKNARISNEQSTKIQSASKKGST